MAQIIKRGDKWLARVRKGKLDKSKTFNTKSAAELWSAKIISDIDLIRSGQSPDKTLRELADKYILDVMTLAKISGHRDLKVLLNTYYSPDMSEVALRL